jgi:UbiD family decarboxylase
VPFDDFRAYLRALALDGELTQLDQPLRVDAAGVLEPTAALRDPGPAALVKRVEGRTGGLAVGVHGSSRRLALALGLPASLSLDELALLAADRAEESADAEYVAPSAAACKQVVLRGSAANPLRFALPAWDADAASILDKALLATRDPNTGAVGLTLAELRVRGPDTLAVAPQLGGPFARHLAATCHAGVPLEVAVVVGNDPTLALVALGDLPAGVDAYVYASALRAHPLLITDCESTELEIPARTEIVLEGLAEPTGPNDSGGALALLAVYTITHRREPIYEALRGGWAGEEARLLERWSTAVRGRQRERVAPVWPAEEIS